MTLNRDKLAEALFRSCYHEDALRPNWPGPFDAHKHIAMRDLDAILDEIHAQGYCIVPENLTDEMADAGYNSLADHNYDTDVDAVWSAMISQGRER